jgi:hypothetical protein
MDHAWSNKEKKKRKISSFDTWNNDNFGKNTNINFGFSSIFNNTRLKKMTILKLGFYVKRDL